MTPAVPGRVHRAALLLAALCALACNTPVWTNPSDPVAVHREITGNVLTRGFPSDRSMQLLDRFGLGEAFARDP